jgi:hypothetical protein
MVLDKDPWHSSVFYVEAETFDYRLRATREILLSQLLRSESDVSVYQSRLGAGQGNTSPWLGSNVRSPWCIRCFTKFWGEHSVNHGWLCTGEDVCQLCGLRPLLHQSMMGLAQEWTPPR